jgi:hypothetical protein
MMMDKSNDIAIKQKLDYSTKPGGKVSRHRRFALLGFNGFGDVCPRRKNLTCRVILLDIRIAPARNCANIKLLMTVSLGSVISALHLSKEIPQTSSSGLEWHPALFRISDSFGEDLDREFQYSH